MSDTHQKPIKILYIDDEEINLQAFKSTFKRDFKILLALSAKDAREILKEEEVDIIITDQRMPVETGLDFLASITPYYNDPIRILLTAYTDIQVVNEAIQKGIIYHYLTKPWDEDYLRNIIRNAYEVYNLRKENLKLKKELAITKDQQDKISG